MGASGFWNVTGYVANNITGRVVSGDFDNDGRQDDIAAFYDYGNNETRIHVWRGSGSSLQYHSALGYWNSTGYNANSLTGRVVAGDFFNDGRVNAIGGFYYVGSGDTRLHVWKHVVSNPYNFEYQGASGLWVDCLPSSILARGTQINLDAESEITKDKITSDITPLKLTIFPNPSANIINIHYKIEKDGNVKLSVFDIMNKKIIEVVNEKQKAGEHNLVFDGSKYDAGIYFCQIEFENLIETKKIIISK